mmetsp:Transcript_16991/g.15346  ORF Transcript_16991/g.15346 Transcript_16991/m.15346 type:complete len:355 (-) Transcript_16991:55-1119(-)
MSTEGLRQRKINEKETKETNEIKNKTKYNEELVKSYLKVLSDKLPPKYRDNVLKLTPYIQLVISFIEASIPIIYHLYVKALEFYELTKPYKLDLLVPSIIGLVLCFFGGSFVTVIAAVEAYRMVGYESTLKAFNDIIVDLKLFLEENKKDDSIDENKDGKPDSVQISSTELLRRKSMLFLKTVDPKRLTNAVSAINHGFLAVIATLKLQFAKSITLGSSIASITEKQVDIYLLPVVETALPPDYKRWGPTIVQYANNSVCITLAWFIQRIISAFHSALRGGLMFSRNILVYINDMGYYKIDHNETNLDEIIGYSVAALGITWQLYNGFYLPFPLNLLLLPFTIIEYVLVWSVSK